MERPESASAEALATEPYEEIAEEALDEYFDKLEDEPTTFDGIWDNDDDNDDEYYEPQRPISQISLEESQHKLHNQSAQSALAPHNSSRFTYHDLHLMSKSATNSPLRVITLIDFDAFYAQCETVRLGLPPEKPLAVRQWNAIIALNYPARAMGLKRGMSVDECKRLCPEIKLQHVATWREGDAKWAYREDRDRMASEKAALEPYREESRRAFKLIEESLVGKPEVLVEKASVDEMYLDLSTYVHSILLEQYPELKATGDIAEDDNLPFPPITRLDWANDNIIGVEARETLDWDDIAMKIGADIVRHLRQTIYDKLHYTASAGIASNKVLAKLGAGCKKPANQTIIRPAAISLFLSTTPYKKIRGLGRQLGDTIHETFGGIYVSDILHITLPQFQSVLGREEGKWTYNTIRGQEFSEVSARSKPQSMLSQKTFTPPVPNIEAAAYWLRMFSKELFERVVALDVPGSSRRRPRTLAVNHHINGRFGPTRRRQGALPPVGGNLTADVIYEVASAKLREICSEEGVSWPCAALGVVISNFVELESGSRDIKTFFSSIAAAEERGSDGSILKESASGLKRRVGGGGSLNENPAKRDKIFDDVVGHQRQADDDDAIGIGYLCPNCEKRVAEGEVIEHLDWHLAMELQDAG